jgi:hypothetical protein
MPKVYRASGTILVNRFVEMSGNSTVQQIGSAGQLPIGVSQHGGRTPPIPDVTTDPVEAAQSGENVQVFTVGEECLVLASATIAAGDKIRGDVDGKGAPSTTSGHSIGGIALEAAANGELFQMLIAPQSIG